MKPEHKLEIARLNGAVKVTLEELTVRQNYAQVENILREVDRRFGLLLAAEADERRAA
jgi:hypothetical protein